MKVEFVILIAILTFNFVSALDLSVSPIDSEIYTNPGEESCINLSVISKTFNGSLVIEDRWAKEKSREVKDYFLLDEKLHLSLIYNKSFYLDGNSHSKVCFRSQEAGNYYGVILLRPESSYFGVGVWVTIHSGNVAEGFDLKKEASEVINLITGKAINNSLTRINGLVILVQTIFTLILLTVLVYLIRKKKEL